MAPSKEKIKEINKYPTSYLRTLFRRSQSDEADLLVLVEVLGRRKTNAAKKLLGEVEVHLSRFFGRKSGSTGNNSSYSVGCAGYTADGRKCKRSALDSQKGIRFCSDHLPEDAVDAGLKVPKSNRSNKKRNTSSKNLAGRSDDRTPESQTTSISIDPSVWIKADDPKADTAVPVAAALREKLLEGLNRGNLINLRHSASSRTHIRIVDVDFDRAFSVLSGQVSGASEFTSLSEPPDEPADERSQRFTFAYSAARRVSAVIDHLLDTLDPDDESDQRTMAEAERNLKDEIRKSLGMSARLQKGVQTAGQIARAQGVNPDSALTSRTVEDPEEGVTLQTLQFPREMSAKLNSIRTGARRAMEESGSVALHAAFGFLEWKPAGGRDRPIMSPIILAPLEFSNSIWQSRRQYVVYPQGDESIMNPALQVRLNDENIMLPEWEGNENPTEYLAKVESAITKKTGWKVHRYLTIGLFESAVITVWEDLDPERWPGDTDPSLHTVVSDLLAGSGERTGESSEEYEIDNPEIAKRLPEPVLDADSSQLSAMIDVLDGKNLAIQGPPGTGKSQTIANTIAAAMHKGKSVLFVAEKMAALDVVKKRLDDVGLGDFVLELHSTKVSRASVYQGFGPRIDLARTLSAPEDYEKRLDELRNVKATLNKYVEVINKPLSGVGRSIHYAIWRIRSLSKHEIPSPLSSFAIENSSKIDQVDLKATLDALRSYQELNLEVAAEFESIHSHPWRFVTEELSPIDQESLRQQVADQLDATKKIIANIENFRWIGLPQNTEASITDLRQIVDHLQQLPDQLSENVSESLVRSLAGELDRKHLADFIEIVKKHLKLSADIRQSLPELQTPPGGEIIEAIIETLEVAEATTVGDLSVKEKEFKSHHSKLLADFDAIKRILREINVQVELTGENIRLIEKIVIALYNVSPSVLRLRSNSYVDDQTVDELDKAISIAGSNQDALSGLSYASIWQRNDSTQLLQQHIYSLREGGFFNRFKKRTKLAIEHWKKLAGTSTKPSSQIMAADLEILRDAILADHELNNNNVLKDFAGKELDGIESDFESIRSAAQYKLAVQSIHGSDIEGASSLRNFMEMAPIDHVMRVASVSHSLLTEPVVNEHELPDNLGINVHMEEVAAVHLKILAAIQSVDSLDIGKEFNKQSLTKLESMCLEFHTAQKQIESLHEVTDKLSDLNLDPFSIDSIEGSLEFFDQLRELDRSTDSNVSIALLKGSLDTNLKKLKDGASELLQDLSVLDQTTLKVVVFGSEQINSASIRNQSIKSTHDSANNANENPGALARWIQLISTRLQAENERTTEVIRIFDQSSKTFDLPSVWEHIFWRSRLNEEFKENEGLRRASGYTQRTARERLQELDGEITNLTRQQFAAELARKKGPWGNSVGRVRELTQTALIEHLSTQQRPRVSVRDFVHRAGEAAVALKPCFMMSPSSVARYLPRGQTMFDIVLMDEASQIRGEEAIGSIARGKQAVVVGDTKQLPPTRFFERIGISDTDDEDYQDVDVESVLEQALSRFPFRTLRWHYRSEHQDLIKFSNKFFYDNKLIVFPSATDAEAMEMGVYFSHMPEAYYQSSSSGRRGGLNPEQANHVAKTAVRSMETRPDWSVGVVAVNKVQAEMIDDQIHLLLQNSPRARKFVNDRDSTLEPFFVKNLENVQGDERDHIIISTVYGSTGPGEPTRQGFGPIGGQHGGRRLNVLFTRAKKRVDVISSMASSDVKDTETSREGVKALKAYLEFAATGRLDGPDEEVSGVPDNDFEASVGSALALAGYEVSYQVGVAGYKIDLGIRHVDFPHGYIAGVECDGATYHSANSARDRDLLRQQQLERLGWNILRVWSTDWFVDPEGEMKRLIENLNLRVQAAKDEFENRVEPQSEFYSENESTQQLDLIDEAIDRAGSMTVDPRHQVKVKKPALRDGQDSDNGSLSTHLTTTRTVKPREDDENEKDSPSNIDRFTDWSNLDPTLAEYIDSAKNIESMPDKRHPSEEEEFNLRMIIETVIDIEGPVHVDMIIDRIRTLYGMGSLRGSPRGRIQSLIASSNHDGIARKYEDFYDLYGQIPWGKDRVPRVAGDRSIEHIDKSELLAACHLVSATQKISDPEDLLKAVANALGYDRIGGAIRSRLLRIVSNCLKLMSAESEKTNLQNNSSPNVSENPLVSRGYDPRLDPASRWMFFLNYAIPELTRDGAINNLHALINYLENRPETPTPMKHAMQEDLSQLQRFQGQH